MLLTSTSDLIQVITGSAVSTMYVHASWVDNTTTTFTPGRTNTQITGAATTTVVGSPGASTQRQVKYLMIRNGSVTASNVITVQHTDGTTVAELVKMTLNPGKQLQYVYDIGFAVVDPSSTAAIEQIYDAEVDFGFVGDLVTVFDGAMTSGSATLTCATSTPFVAGDVGKRVTVARAGASNAQLTSTITGFTSSSVVTLGDTAGSTVTSAGVSFGTDNTTAITTMVNTVNNASFPGATILFGRSATNAYGFPTRPVFNKLAQIVGIGGGHTADTGDYTRIGGTRLAWWGASLDGGVAFGPFFEFSPSGVQSLKRVAFRHCWLDCRNGDQNEALIGLKLASCHAFMLEDFFIMDAAAIALWTDIDGDPTEAKDTTRWQISQFCTRMLDNPTGAVVSGVTTSSAVTLSVTPQSLTVTANSLPAAGYVWIGTNLGSPALVRYTGGGGTTTLTGCTIFAENLNAPATVSGANVVQAVPGNGCAFYFGGGTGANTCCSIVTQAQLSHGTTWGPAAIEFHNADSVELHSVYINGGNATNDGAINRIRKPGVRFNGSNTSATLASRNNTFRGGSAGAGGVSAMGVLNTSSRMLAMSGPQYWDLYQMGNGEPIPVVEGNAYLDWQPNGGMRAGQRGSTSVANQSISAATLTLITGTIAQIPPQGYQVGEVIKFRAIGTGAAAGTAANTITIRQGTNGTTADAAIATFTTTAGTAAASEFMIEVILTVQSLGASAAGVAECVINNSTATGFINATVNVLAGTMATWNSTTAQQFIHMDITTGASKTLTMKQGMVEIVNPANP